MPYQIVCANPACQKSFLIPRTALLHEVVCGHCGYRFVVRPKRSAALPSADSPEVFDQELASFLESYTPDDPDFDDPPPESPQSRRSAAARGPVRGPSGGRAPTAPRARGLPRAAAASQAARSPSSRARVVTSPRPSALHSLGLAVAAALGRVAAGLAALVHLLGDAFSARRSSAGQTVHEPPDSETQDETHGQPQGDMSGWEKEFIRMWREKSQTWKRR